MTAVSKQQSQTVEIILGEGQWGCGSLPKQENSQIHALKLGCRKQNSRNHSYQYTLYTVLSSGWGTALQVRRSRFDSRWSHWNYSLTQSFRLHRGPGVESASNINEYQEYFLGGKGSRCVWMTTLPLSYADCLEIWEPRSPGTLRACPGL